MVRLLAPLFTILFLAAAAPRAQSLLIVDDDGGPGVFTEIQDAVFASVSGDCILVRSGYYGGFVAGPHRLTIRADDGADVQIRGPAWVTTAVEPVSISGFRVDHIWPAYIGFCTAPVLIENCEFTTTAALTGGSLPALDIENCSEVVLTGVRAVGNAGDADAPAMRVEGSTVTMYDCFVDGGVAGPGGCPGEPGLLAVDSRVFASGSILRGGAGPEWTSPGSCNLTDPGGPAYVIRGTTELVLLDTRVQPGRARASNSRPPPPYVPGGQPPVVEPPATVTVLPVRLPARIVEAPAVVRSGQRSQIDFGGSPGETVFAILSTDVTPLTLPFVMGPIVPAAPWVAVRVGVLGLSGQDSLRFSATLPVTTACAWMSVQGLFLSVADGIVLGAPRSVLLVPAGT